jgi:hypothetical protein
MMQIGLIGIGAGAAAALLFASVTSGSWLSVILFYLAPLPIMIAGLGWSHWAALVAGLAAATAIGLTFGGAFFLAFVAGAGIPAWWLTYLTLLARPAAAAGGNPNERALEWYPPGRLVVWAAVLAALIVLFVMPNFGLDAESFRAGLSDALNGMFQVDKDGGLPNSDYTKRLIEFLVTIIPPAAAVLATVTSLVNLWLAGRVVKFSGRLARPWPELSTMTFPPLTAAALAIATALSFFDGIVGIVAGVLSASLFMAYSVLGLAVLHDITRGIASRPFLIGGAYASVAVLAAWPVLLFALLGLAETMLNIRARVAKRRGPIAPT